MSYLKRKDGTVQTVDGQPVDYVKQQFVVVDANSVAEGSPSEDLLTQDAFNRFLLLTIAHVRNLQIPFTATAQTYTATEEDYREKFGTASVAYPVTANSSLGYDRWLQSTADAMARAKARETVLNKLRFSPLPNTKNTVVVYGSTEEETDALGPNTYRQYNTYVTSKQPVKDIQFYTLQNGQLVPVGTGYVVEFVLYTIYFRADDNDTTYANGPYDVVAVATLIDGTKVQSAPRRINLNMPAVVPPPPLAVPTLTQQYSWPAVYPNTSVRFLLNKDTLTADTISSLTLAEVWHLPDGTVQERDVDYASTLARGSVPTSITITPSALGEHTIYLTFGTGFGPIRLVKTVNVIAEPTLTVNGVPSGQGYVPATVGVPVTVAPVFDGPAQPSPVASVSYSARGFDQSYNLSGDDFVMGTTTGEPIQFAFNHAGQFQVVATFLYQDTRIRSTTCYGPILNVAAAVA